MQQDNYGRGGIPGDRLHVQAQDYTGMNNANMLTPADGSSPRMQMYVYTAPSERSLSVLNMTLPTSSASYARAGTISPASSPNG